MSDEIRVVHGGFRSIAKDPVTGKNSRWKCMDCGVEGPTIDSIQEVECTAPMPEPCDYCGGRIECAPDCMGVAMALNGLDPDTGQHIANTHVIGDTDPERGGGND